jgi:hypothetical protein
MLDALIDILAGAYDAARHRVLLGELWDQERWFDTPHQRRAAEIARDALAAGGLAEAAVVPFPADGRTRFQDWTTHLAWECPDARLSLGGEVLADRSSCPTASVQWSGPLEPTSAPVVDGDALQTIRPQDVQGKFVLTARPPREMKQLVHAMGPVAVVSDFLGKGLLYDPDTTRWCNTWAEGPDGWYFRASDAVMPGFSLSPRQGALLRKRLAADPALRLAGCCRSRLYAGESQCVTALVPGRDPSREIWLYGHACEQGAHDNASGVSAIVEAMRLLAAAIGRGDLARPRFGIRVLATEECIGMLAFATRREDARRRALAGLNVDSVGGAGEAAAPYRLFFGPLSSPTFGWALAGEIGRLLAARSRGEWHVAGQREVLVSDDMIADPACGVPGLWLGGGGKQSPGYHSSRDTPEVCTEASLRSSTLLAAAWAYVMASLDDRSARSLLAPAARWIDENVVPADDPAGAELRRWAAGRMLRDLGRWGIQAAVYEAEAARYAPASAEPLADLPREGPRLVRRTWGAYTLETLPAERAGRFSRWSHEQAASLYWCDGRRPLAAVERLARAELGKVSEGRLAALAEACIEAGVAEWA